MVHPMLTVTWENWRWWGISQVGWTALLYVFMNITMLD